ncbi:hypothetical protein ABT324_27990 [Saccharopolyspora sp. NPDC000359]|uniref:type II toxin-antitoxin system Phd/YefM family antitoxin n=1 Tax=Saccharopolyspora sp. NPDC000359 TaxID=3154251 RepID=UPI00332863CA
MTTVTSEQFNKDRSAILRDVRKRGEEFEVVFHGKPGAAIIPAAQRQAERDELERLRRQVAELEQRLREATALT